ncbi:AAA family ATPase [Mucilaginibacter gilvus]|uniref:AAA family ATPase n=1 Tax=Mucilaginibacter gilvus TaxID=2305909 RepID=A0A444MHX1_9SPHI|nr:AAA family ATPase [Mucilaginibacter gilvus]RWY47143.1 AAA family ATPase [Mucilaginibacter gilvus]
MNQNHAFKRPDSIEQIRAEVRGTPFRPAKKSVKQVVTKPDPDDCRYLLAIATGNRWMELGEREPQAQMLFGELWFQNELCILFADTNVGKSVLAVQVGHSIAQGRAIAPFYLQAPPATVLYIDFELSTQQFYRRYSNDKQVFKFSENFYRAQFNTGYQPAGDYTQDDDLLIAAIDYKIRLVHATVLIIDNISCLRGGTENASVALHLMKNLKNLKTDHNLSILVLAHTPKRRNPGQPLSADDLHGSKLLINLADSAFAIGTSSADRQLRYLKQIKQRSSAQVYGEDHICLCRIVKPHHFLQMQFEGHSHERLHLRTRHMLNREILAPKVAELAAKGYKQRQISSELCIAVGLVNKLMPGKVPVIGAVITQSAG